jgi:hypothetical protein
MVPEPIPNASREFDTLIREYSCPVEIPMLGVGVHIPGDVDD